MEDSRSKHGMFGWNELLTTDPAAAKEFYTQLFGWTTQVFPMGAHDYTIVKMGEVDIGGIMSIPECPKACRLRGEPTSLWTMLTPPPQKRKNWAARSSLHQPIYPPLAGLLSSRIRRVRSSRRLLT
jgi:hypothetical protein